MVRNKTVEAFIIIVIWVLVLLFILFIVASVYSQETSTAQQGFENLSEREIALATDCAAASLTSPQGEAPSVATAFIWINSYCDLNADGVWNIDEVTLGGDYEIEIGKRDFTMHCGVDDPCIISDEPGTRFAIRRIAREGWENTDGALRIGTVFTGTQNANFGVRHWAPIVSIDPESAGLPMLRTLLAFWKTRDDLPSPRFDCHLDFTVFFNRLDEPGDQFSKTISEIPPNSTLVHALPEGPWFGHGDGAYIIEKSSHCHKYYENVVGRNYLEHLPRQLIFVGDWSAHAPHVTYLPIGIS